MTAQAAEAEETAVEATEEELRVAEVRAAVVTEAEAKALPWTAPLGACWRRWQERFAWDWQHTCALLHWSRAHRGARPLSRNPLAYQEATQVTLCDSVRMFTTKHDTRLRGATRGRSREHVFWS